MAQYKYYVDNVESFPLNGSTQTYKYERLTTSSAVFDLDIEGKFIFNANGSPGYSFKTAQASATGFCDEIPFRIEQRCGDSGTYAIIWEGTFAIPDGEFDDDKCLYSIKPRKKLFLLQEVEVNLLDIPERVKGSSVTGVVYTGTGGNRTYPNCVWLSDALLYIAQKTNPLINSVISNFFQINPTAVFPLPVTNYWDYLALAALSDIQEPVPSNAATIEYITFQKLMEDLNVLFDVHWYIDSGYNLRIEHSTHFEGSPGLDLTATTYESYIAGTNKYSYDLKNIPKQEVWKIADHDYHLSLTYGGLANINKTLNQKTYQTTAIRTDYYKIRVGLQNSTSNGFFLFATDGGSGSGGTEIRMLQSSQQNHRLTPNYLVSNLHLYNRPSLYALIISEYKDNTRTSSGGITLESMRPILKQEPFKIPICCDTFNTEDQVVTALGNGYLEKAEFGARDTMMKLELKYKIDNCSRDPDDITGLDLWLKYNEGISGTLGGGGAGVGTGVTRWIDASGNGRDATQSGGDLTKPRWTSGNTMVFYDDTGGANAFGGLFLTTPSFQLFPSKRGTIFILINYNLCHILGGCPSTYYPTGPIPVLSTNDGGASNYFDILFDASNVLRSTNYSAAAYPVNGLTGTSFIGLYVIRRSADDRFYCRVNSVECKDNPMIITNNQPTSKPLIIGHNANIYNAVVPAYFGLDEILVYNRDLSIREIEDVELSLVKRGVYNRTYP